MKIPYDIFNYYILFFKTLKLTIMETKKLSKIKNLNAVIESAISRIQLVIRLMVILQQCEYVSGYYRHTGNRLRWINGYWRTKRTEVTT